MAWWQFWRKKPAIVPRQYGLVEKRVPGHLYLAEGWIKNFPFKYRLSAIPSGRTGVTEETTVSYSEIVAEILRYERRDLHKRAIYALFHYRPANFVIRFEAIAASGKEIILLEESVYIGVYYRDTPSLVREVCRAIAHIAENLHADTEALDLKSRVAMRNALLYPAPQTKMFWINVTIQFYVAAVSRD